MQRALVERARDGDLEAFTQLVKVSSPQARWRRQPHPARLGSRSGCRPGCAADGLARSARPPRSGCVGCVARSPDRASLLQGRAEGSAADPWWSCSRRPTQRRRGPRTPRARSANGDWLGRELGRLDIDQRAVVVLHYYLDLPVREVAEYPRYPIRDGCVPSSPRSRDHARSIRAGRETSTSLGSERSL